MTYKKTTAELNALTGIKIFNEKKISVAQALKISKRRHSSPDIIKKLAEAGLMVKNGNSFVAKEGVSEKEVRDAVMKAYYRKDYSPRKEKNGPHKKKKSTPVSQKRHTPRIKTENKSQIVSLAKRFSLMGEYDMANKLLDKI